MIAAASYRVSIFTFVVEFVAEAQNNQIAGDYMGRTDHLGDE
jgi:hypothetical protein